MQNGIRFMVAESDERIINANYVDDIFRQEILEELKKCVLLCANCHGEVHSGLTKLIVNNTFWIDNIIKEQERIGIQKELKFPEKNG